MNNQPNRNYYDNTAPYSAGPGGNPPVNKQNKKPVAVILAAVFAFLICAIGVVAGILIFTSQDSSGQIVKLLEERRYDEAYDLYEKKYGDGTSDEKLEDALYNRLCDLEDEYADGDITKKKALEEVDTIEKMDIDALAEDIEKTKNYINNLNSDDNSSSDSSAGSDSASSTETTAYTPVEPDPTYLPSEPIPEQSTYLTPVISYATTLAGTVLPSSNENSARSFGANKAIDGYYDSCWCVNTSNTGGAGASIRFTLTGKSYVHGIRIINGNNYHPSEDIYRSNGQVKSFTLTFSDGTTKTFTASYNGTASNSYQDFAFDAPVATEYITLTVNSGYTGAKYTTNVCLGEFAVY